jgi:hypothetical protein
VKEKLKEGCFVQMCDMIPGGLKKIAKEPQHTYMCGGRMSSSRHSLMWLSKAIPADGLSPATPFPKRIAHWCDNLAASFRIPSSWKRG